ncbi:glycosyl hydrolase [Parabacteroides sp. PF5-6]|uniref:alpha-L-rhamnosidase n=1 Tax=Parabacteroides sp. PF5-6 TaxID=1742403 RepID=UPI002406EB58|nr:glycosyl hydrolase [Parabacteroides sp. PF5-6]MDF9829957.1 hypothetical protein [Parabacteroides sp. PF5-6]
MKRYTYFLVLFSLWLCAACQREPADTQWPEITQESKPWTRWWWMGSAVNEAGLSYNLHELAKAGMGGVEITPIYGVKGEEANAIPYLSPHWMRMLYFAKAEAKRLGMGIDMNMGTGWPFGGPHVALEDAATRAIFQEYEYKSGKPFSEKITVEDEKQKEIARLNKLIAYAPGKACIDLTAEVAEDGTLTWDAPQGNWRLIALFTGKTLQQVKRAAPGGEGYVLNPFDAEAVRRYFAVFNEAFHKIPGSWPKHFFNDSFEVYGADWTPDFLEQFERRRGYKLQDYFPEFLEKGKSERSARILSDYRETLGELLKENFTQAWTEWAHERGVRTRNQAHGSPANLIDLYAAVDIPECETFGITDFDIPGLRKDSIRKENDGDPATLKFASSAAHISGKPLTSAETFTWLTEHFRTSLSQCKPEIDQMFVAGVNRVYFHGATYSPREAAWPGWKFYAAVDLSPTNTIWHDAAPFFSYIARAQSFLQDGAPDNDFLLYLPIYDFWHDQTGSHYLSFAIHGLRDLLPAFYQTVAEVKNEGYALDYISDRFLQTTTVENGLLHTEGGATYKALILPAVKRLPVETLARIRQLAEQGATILFAGRYPSDVPGLSQLNERQGQMKELLRAFPPANQFTKTTVSAMDKGKIITGKRYKEMLPLTEVKPEVFQTQFGGELIRRRHADGYHYFFTLLQNRPVDGWVPLAVEARSAVFFDPMTGETGKASLRKKEGQTEVYLQLKPGQSVILKTFTDKQVSVSNWNYRKETGTALALPDDWTMHFTASDPEIKETFALPALGSWTDLDREDLKRNKGTARYSTRFHFTPNAGCDYLLDLGDVRESARVYLNGTFVATLFAVPFEALITDYLKEGENLIEVEVTNLPANRIADYDRQGIEWRKFHEINFVSITYKDTPFDHWGVIPSGLLGPVSIKELKSYIP